MPKKKEYLELDPAPARGKHPNLNDLWNHPQWIAETKADGWRYLMHFGGDCRRTYLTGRHISKSTGKFSEKGLCAPNLTPSIPTPRLGYTVVDGEVMPPVGFQFRDLAGIMNVTPAKASRRIQEIGVPQFFTFDLLFYDGEDVRQSPLAVRRNLMYSLHRTIFKSSKSVFTMTSAEIQKYKFYESIISQGGEGVILKDLSSVYGKGWIKVKRFHTLDCVITGFTKGKGKYEGMIGAVEVSVYKKGKLVKVGQVSGMTDHKREVISESPEKYLGKVLEIKAQEFLKNSLRHPRWSRLRHDVNARSATWEKMKEDLETLKR